MSQGNEVTPGGTRAALCPKCQSPRLMTGVRVADRGEGNWTGELALEVDERPEAFIFKGTHKYPTTATVCGDCGFTELYVRNPAGLLRLYEAQRREARGTGGARD